MTADQTLAFVYAAILLVTSLTTIALGILQDRQSERRRIEDEARRRLAKRIRMVALMGDGSRPVPASLTVGEGR